MSNPAINNDDYSFYYQTDAKVLQKVHSPFGLLSNLRMLVESFPSQEHKAK
jgi:hypothetical protein